MNLRKCSFEPEKYLRRSTGGKNIYLPAPARMLWFETYCEENNIKHDIHITPAVHLDHTTYIQCEAIVHMDGVEYTDVAGVGINSFRDNGSAIQTASTLAKGKALMNAGFTGEFDIDADIIPSYDSAAAMCQQPTSYQQSAVNQQDNITNSPYA